MKLSKAGRDLHPKKQDRQGVVTSTKVVNHEQLRTVAWDGIRTRDTYHVQFLEEVQALCSHGRIATICSVCEGHPAI